MTRSFIILLCISFILISCNKKGQQNVYTSKPGREDIEDVNTHLVEKDRERIENYISRKGLEMKETGTGLWYTVLKEGNGSYFVENDRVELIYKCSLLDGTLCYSSELNGPKSVVIGRSEMESGLAEGLKLIRGGSSAVFIIPAYLAWGIVGDGKAIPPRSVIVYELEASFGGKEFGK